MNPITMYFAGAAGRDESLIELCGRNRLCSFLYPEQLKKWFECSKDVEGKILIDSGAFSAWNRGKIVDFDKYISYCKEALSSPLAKNKIIRCVNLDVIPGKVGETLNLNKSVKKEDKEIIEEAAKQGYKNLCFFIKQGIVPIHVFHQGEDFKWLDKMVEKTDYIGVSPANDVGMNQKRFWIDRVFSYLEKNNIKIKTHGFAVWSSSIMLDFPWTSCDAATWQMSAGMGQIHYPVGGFKNPDYSQNSIIITISENKFKVELYSFGKEIEKMFKEDGYNPEELKKDWKVRTKVNIRYFLGLEKWLNEKKEKSTFKIRKTLLGDN